MDMTDIDQCSSCGMPLDLTVLGVTTCTPCRREASRAVVETVALSPTRPVEHGDIVRPVLNRAAHRQLEFDLDGMVTIDLDRLVSALHGAIDVAASNLSAADGFPTSTPGAAPSTAHTVIEDAPLFDGDDEHGPVNLTPVEAAVHTRALARRDKYDHHLEQALAFFGDASRALRAASNRVALLTKMQEHSADRPDDSQQCWAMARIGEHEAVRSTVVIDGDRRPLGRWAYDFHRRTGRLPSIEECRKRARAEKVFVPADTRRTVTR